MAGTREGRSIVAALKVVFVHRPKLPDVGPCDIGAGREAGIARPYERLGGTGVEATPARTAAVRFEREIRREIGVRQDDTDEREGTDLRMDEHHVLADPSEPGELRELAFRDRTRVDVAARGR